MTIGCRGIPGHRSETCPARMPLKLNSLVRNSEQGLAWRSRGLVRTHTPFPDLGNQFELHDAEEGTRVKIHPGFHPSLATKRGGSRSLLTDSKRPPKPSASEKLASSAQNKATVRSAASNMGSAAALTIRGDSWACFRQKKTPVQKPESGSVKPLTRRCQSSEYRRGQLVSHHPTQ
jgi:hypothetical protein